MRAALIVQMFMPPTFEKDQIVKYPLLIQVSIVYNLNKANIEIDAYFWCRFDSVCLGLWWTWITEC